MMPSRPNEQLKGPYTVNTPSTVANGAPRVIPVPKRNGHNIRAPSLGSIPRSPCDHINDRKAHYAYDPSLYEYAVPGTEGPSHAPSVPSRQSCASSVPNTKTVYPSPSLPPYPDHHDSEKAFLLSVDPYGHPCRIAGKPNRHSRISGTATYKLRTRLGLGFLLLLLLGIGYLREWALFTSHPWSDMGAGFKALVTSLLALYGELDAAPSSFPSSFPKSGKVLWYTSPGTAWSKQYLPVGNGYIAAMVPGGTNYEDMTVNIEDLWNGGPFQSPDYNGGNPSVSDSSTIHANMQKIRTSIFNSPTGTISGDEFDVITSPVIDYGSYASPGRFAVSLTGNSTSGPSSNFIRWLDLDEGVARSQWNVGNVQVTRETFCSHPTRACTQLTSSNTRSSLSLTYAFIGPTDIPEPSVTCLDNSTLLIRGVPWNPGMDYEILARIQTDPPNLSKCTFVEPVGNGSANATISVTGATSSWLTWVGGTNFDQDAGDAAHGYSFAGSDPHDSLMSNLNSISKRSVSSLLNEHLDDITSTLSTNAPFQLDLGQQVDLSKPTDLLFLEYEVDTGNPYLEWLTFHFGRYLLWGSARGNLPANLQGKWARDGFNPWGADYHSNINIQMNYWSAEPTGLDVTGSLFDYFEKNWAPRGAETAQLLYNISRGWVVHNEMNIFGFTGMKGVGGTAQWADYPEANVWMMLHVWDHFDYTGDVAWFKRQGWPLLKGVASFHLDKLIDDLHFNDGTLVVAPCNSPEQPPITFGCAHAQQLIWILFNAIEKGFAASGDTDTTFLQEVQSKKAKMDKGLHIGSWGQLQEWKFDMDSQTDTHRHLSHLIGLYPGYAISNFAGQTNNTKEEILNAAEVSLIHRGNGTGPDADAGWEKVWRAASWAQFGNASQFYHELTYALQRDFGPNLFSLYDPGSSDPIFQIDANLGYPGAVINALLQAPDVPSLSTPLTITLLPALPAAWNTGSFKAARVRGGISVDLAWRNGKPTSGVIRVDRSAPSRPIVVVFQGKQIAKFTTASGKTTSLSFS